MKKINALPWIVFFCCALLVMGCKKKSDPQPPSQLLQRSWQTQSVTEGGTQVYTAPYNAGTDLRDYSQFKIVFTANSVTLTEIDGNQFTGNWALSNDNTTLTLTNLNTQPTGTNGTITYTNVSVTENQLIMTRSGNNPKTGVSSVQYTMVPVQ